MKPAREPSSDLVVKTFAVGPLQCNCSILMDSRTKQALLIDPGDDFDRIRGEVENLGADVRYIIHTHAHFDHIGASEPAHLHWKKAPLLLHPGDRFLWDNLPLQGRLFGFELEKIQAEPEDLIDEKEIEFGNSKLKTVFTPGHTPGSCSFSVGEFLFAGDTLFQNSVGRTDLWGGDFHQLSKSIKSRLYTLDDETQVICGHGPNTLIGVERKSNPFVTG